MRSTTKQAGRQQQCGFTSYPHLQTRKKRDTRPPNNISTFGFDIKNRIILSSCH